ncbi:MAG: YcfL family protein [Opitutales bacterium]
MKTNRHTRISFFTMIVTVALLSGCSGNPVISAEKKNPADDSSGPELSRVEVSGGLAKDIEVNSVRQAKVSGDLLKVQFNVRNVGSKARRILYRVEWFDADGIMINDSSLVALSHLVRAGEPVALQSVATTPMAQNFRIKIQAAKAN